jgi:hypothetical protein
VKITSLIPSAVAVSLLGTAVLAAVTFAQAPQTPPNAGGPPMQQGGMPGMPGGMGHEHNFPAPTNLKVLPKDLTGAQVREIMHHWAGDLGVECDTCHAAYADGRKSPNGWPMLDFPSDAKPEKRMARIMYTMLELDKKDYVAKVAAMDTMGSPAAPLTCGTCHRGSLDPAAYEPPHHEHGPMPQGPPPAGAPAPPGN